MKPDHRAKAVAAAAKWLYIEGRYYEDWIPATLDAPKVLDAARPHERAAFMEEVAPPFRKLSSTIGRARLALDRDNIDRAVTELYDAAEAMGELRAAFESIGEPEMCNCKRHSSDHPWEPGVCVEETWEQSEGQGR